MKSHRLVLFGKRLGDTNHAGQYSFEYEALRFANLFHSEHQGKTFDPRKPVAAPEPFTDMWAGIFSHLLGSGALDAAVLRDAMNCCFDIMKDQGYALIDIPRKVYPSPRAHVALLVAGCQTKIMLRSRAYAAAELYYLLTTETTSSTHCLFSGSHPPRDGRFAEPDECGTIACHFRHYYAERLGKDVQDFDIEPSILDKEIAFDAESTKTEANVDAFCEMLSRTFSKCHQGQTSS